MTYAELINESLDALQEPAHTHVESVAGLVADYCLKNTMDIKDFNFVLFFLSLESL
jgi:hypothetical protein